MTSAISAVIIELPASETTFFHCNVVIFSNCFNIKKQID